MDERIDQIEKFLSRVEPAWKDIARGTRPASRREQFPDHDPLAGAAHPDMVIDHDQTKRDREMLGFDTPTGILAPADGVDPSGEKPKPDDAEAVRIELLNKLDRFRGVDGYAVPDPGATTDQLRAALDVAEQREKALKQDPTKQS